MRISRNITSTGDAADPASAARAAAALAHSAASVQPGCAAIASRRLTRPGASSSTIR
jgi:hypothetical protein